MRRAAIFLHICVALAAPAFGDIVYMSDGKVHRGEVSRDGDKVLIKKALATIAVDIKDVHKIVKSDTPGTRPVDPPIAATVTLDTPLTGPDRYTRPEPHVFLAMRQLAGTPGGTTAYELRQQIKTWQVRTHDRERKFMNRWIAPRDMERAREEFSARLGKTKDLVTKLRRAGSATAAGRAAQAQYRHSLASHFREAAQVWPDLLMRDFLMAVSHLEGLNYNGSLQTFDKCIAAAPRVAAFRQGKALALAGRNQKIEALAACLEVLHLQPDSRDAHNMVKQAMTDTPGELMADPTFVMAKEIMELYEESGSRTYSPRGITWLMPGRPWTGREFVLLTPPYDRLVFRQAVGVPVGKNALLVDESAVAGALETYVTIRPGVVVPARPQRTSTWGRRKDPAPLGIVTVGDFDFTPLKADGSAQIAKQQMLTVYGLDLYEEMGGEVRQMSALVEDIEPGGVLRLSRKLAPGETAGPVVTKDGQLVGFLGGKTDAMVDGGGPDRFIPVLEVADLVKQAGRTRSFSGGYSRVKRKVAPKPAQGRFFVVHITAAEGPEGKRL
ncbi:MAG: hypothetical protein WBF17_03505 [Phycisphaerae bacterium]